MNQPAISLSQMLGLLKDAVSQLFSEGFWLTAEVLQLSGSGHRYLELVEYDDNRKELAKSRGVIWKGDADMLRRFQACTGNQLSAGMKILFKAKPTFHEVYGLTLQIQDIDPTFTLGDMEARLNQIRQHLKDNNWWNMNRQLAIPKEFCRLAVISPADAAGLGDFRVDADKLERSRVCAFSYFPAAFQGDEAANQIVAQMVQVLEQHKADPFDALVIIRGGGDKAGLYHLNHRRLATAVCRFPLPIMVGIGHERDSVLLDEVANSRFSTPSLLIAHIRHTIIQNARSAQECWDRITHLSSKALDRAESGCEQHRALITGDSRRQLEIAMNRLDHQDHLVKNEANNCIVRSEIALQGHQLGFGSLAHTLCDSVEDQATMVRDRVIKLATSAVQVAERLIESNGSSVMSCNPIAILGRGYAYVKTENRFITKPCDVASGDQIKIHFNDGVVSARVGEL